MMARRPAGRLVLDPLARIVAGGDVLHLVQRRGAFDVRGRDVPRLHERLAPVLDGRFTRDQLLTLVGPQVGAVERYLDHLFDCGVLHEERPPQGLPIGFPQPRPGRQEVVVGDARIAVSLDAPVSPPADLSLSFASREQIERKLLDLKSRQLAAGHIWVVPSREPDRAEWERRAAIARHLLAVELGRGRSQRLSVFRLISEPLALERLALIEPPAAPLDTLPLQLKWVRPLDCPQLPLVTMVVELAASSHGRRVGYGLAAREVQSALVIAFLGREALLCASNTGVVNARLAYLGEAAGPSNGVLMPADAVGAIVASSPSACAEELVCQWARSSTKTTGREIDLLDVRAPSRRVAVLQDMLRARRGSIHGRLDEGLSPLFVLRTEHEVVARVGFEETLAEALMKMAAHEFEVDAPAALACVPSHRHRTTVRRRLRAVLLRLPCRLPALRGQIRRFGYTLFFGALVGDPELKS